jgi:Ni,Fe-hydrogenase III large subunit
MNTDLVKKNNLKSYSLDTIPFFPIETFRNLAVSEIKKGARAAAFFGFKNSDTTNSLILILAYDEQALLAPVKTVVKHSFLSLAPQIPQVHLFEREIYENLAIEPLGHPMLKLVRLKARPNQQDPEKETEFFKILGTETHEVAVGPVHAGIIEPGHFRFHCHGETVYHLEIDLGYQHRGIEKAILKGPGNKRIHYMETLAGDTTIGHCLAFCRAVESLSNCRVPIRGDIIRAILLELERLANHTGDIGALCQDVGYLPTSSYCGRLRGDFLNLTALICGNRFGRNILRPGGVLFDLNETLIKELKTRLADISTDLEKAIHLAFGSTSLIDRFDDTGILDQNSAIDLGLVGVAARACGLNRDVRFNYPVENIHLKNSSPALAKEGDVFARAYVRRLEIKSSIEFINHCLDNIPGGEIFVKPGKMKENCLTAVLVEAWRGEICHTLVTDEKGSIGHYKITDPSFHNWYALAHAMKNEEISNFPLCNKSFNLSYCGHDL